MARLEQAVYLATEVASAAILGADTVVAESRWEWARWSSSGEE